MSSLWISTVLLLLLCCHGFGFKQQLRLYMDNGNVLEFRTNVADMKNYTALLSTVHTYCTLGMWFSFSDVNYGTFGYTLSSLGDDSFLCSSVYGPYIKSIRHLGSNDTSIDSISLFEGDKPDGTELLIFARAYTGISHPIGFVAATGRAEWMLFEGKVLDGNSWCFRIPSDLVFFFVPLRMSDLTTVGSVFKGCDLQEIQAYRNSNLML